MALIKGKEQFTARNFFVTAIDGGGFADTDGAAPFGQVNRKGEEVTRPHRPVEPGLVDSRQEGHRTGIITL